MLLSVALVITSPSQTGQRQQFKNIETVMYYSAQVFIYAPLAIEDRLVLNLRTR